MIALLTCYAVFALVLWLVSRWLRKHKGYGIADGISKITNAINERAGKGHRRNKVRSWVRQRKAGLICLAWVAFDTYIFIYSDNFWFGMIWVTMGLSQVTSYSITRWGKRREGVLNWGGIFLLILTLVMPVCILLGMSLPAYTAIPAGLLVGVLFWMAVGVLIWRKFAKPSLIYRSWHLQK